VLLTGGALCLYVATPHQRLLAARPSPRPVRAAGSVCLAAALAILLALMGPATAVFTWAIGLMAAWTIPPVAIAWLRHRRQTGR
jgi:hypothetical protein